MEKGLKTGMRGRFCEIEIDNQKRFVEIYIHEYDEYQLDRLKRIGLLDDSELGGFLNLINVEISSDTRFLYKVQTYLNNLETEDLWEFNDNIREYQEIGFLEIEEVLNFCKENFNINISNFVPLDETSIPN